MKPTTTNLTQKKNVFFCVKFVVVDTVSFSCKIIFVKHSTIILKRDIAPQFFFRTQIHPYKNVIGPFQFDKGKTVYCITITAGPHQPGFYPLLRNFRLYEIVFVIHY